MKYARLIFWILALCLIFTAGIVQIRSGNAGDKNWLLLAAKRWLEGERLDVDFIEVNPPLIIWLYAIPEWISLRLLPLTDFEVLGYMGLMVCALAVWLSVLVVRQHPEFSADRRKQAYFALLLLAMFILFTHQVYFFDRDHIFMVTTFPYMLRFMPTLARQRFSLPLRLALSLLAAIGFCIKPHTLIFFGAIQLLYILRERSLAILKSLENAIIYSIALMYFFSIWKFTPDYLSIIMPMVALTYSAFSVRFSAYLYVSAAFMSAGLTFADFRLRYTTPYRKDGLYFIGICGAFLLYALTGNGWGYTYNPLLCMLIFLSGWMLEDYGWLKKNAEAHGQDARSFIYGRRGCIANIVLNLAYSTLCLIVFFFNTGCDLRMECSSNQSFVNYFEENHVRSFGTLSMNFRIWSSVARVSGAKWETRFNHLWMLPKLLQENQSFRDAHSWIIDYTGQGLARDLNFRKPDILLVDASDAILGYPHPVDMVKFFSAVPEFKDALTHYDHAVTLDHCLVGTKDGKTTHTTAPPQLDCRFIVYKRLPE